MSKEFLALSNSAAEVHPLHWWRCHTFRVDKEKVLTRVLQQNRIGAHYYFLLEPRGPLMRRKIAADGQHGVRTLRRAEIATTATGHFIS